MHGEPEGRLTLQTNLMITVDGHDPMFVAEVQALFLGNASETLCTSLAKTLVC